MVFPKLLMLFSTGFSVRSWQAAMINFSVRSSHSNQSK